MGVGRTPALVATAWTEGHPETYALRSADTSAGMPVQTPRTHTASNQSSNGWIAVVACFTRCTRCVEGHHIVLGGKGRAVRSMVVHGARSDADHHAARGRGTDGARRVAGLLRAPQERRGGLMRITTSPRTNR